jgi:flagellar FliJ protein
VSEPAFRFRLERVHWLRQQTERSAQEELATSIGRHLHSQRSLHEIDATIESAQRSERVATGAGTGTVRDGEALLAMDAYLERLAGFRAAAARALTDSESEVDDRRRGLLVAARKRQALDRLRDRRLAEHRQEATRAEGGQLDELALAAHRRGRAA